MKTKKPFLFLLAAAALTTSSCSTIQGKESGEKIASSGPTVLFARTQPGTIELDRDLVPIQSAQVLADVKDFKSKITDVKLQFQNVPLEVPMENIGGTTWRAVLSPRQLELLAVSGKTIKYDAQVVARNEEGQVGMSEKPVQVAIKAPDISKKTG